MYLCPKCHSGSIHWSRCHNILERFFALVKYQYYRCDECGWRGKRRVEAGYEVWTYGKKRLTYCLIALAISLAVVCAMRSFLP